MKTDKGDILAVLRTSKDYVSGQQLCDKFQVSRTAVWKVIKQLKEEGYQIEAVPNKGYRLVESPDVLSYSEIISRLHTEWAGRNLHYFEKTGSTNSDAKRYAEEGEPHGTTVVADMQESGKGRRGRSWQSPSGSAIYMSILLRPHFEPDRASMLTLVMALSVSDAITEITGLPTGIKWPNDVVADRKKICGILTEMSVELDYIQYVVIGVGINVNNESEMDFSEDIRPHVTSLRLSSGRLVSRAALIERVLAHFEKNYDIFVTNKDLSELKKTYESHLVNLDVQVKVLDPKGEYTGIARGINNSGELLVEKADGEIINVFAGEVSVRGIYGYV